MIWGQEFDVVSDVACSGTFDSRVPGCSCREANDFLELWVISHVESVELLVCADASQIVITSS